MEIKYFENYLEQQYDEGKIDTMFPDKKGNVKLCCPFKHKRSVFDDETWEEKEIEYLYRSKSGSKRKRRKTCV